ncbi:MAG TPA: hypothetical protein PKE45_25260 [Caldilineaceae bacterium]|nr:hypothetical protein [Caldilineaceae bacterium]
MRWALLVVLLALPLLAACGKVAPSQPATEREKSPVVTIFKAPT